MPRCIVDGADADQTVSATIAGQRVDMCLYHWACWARLGESVYQGLLRRLTWQTPLWRHGEAQYQIAWEAGQVVARRLSNNQVIAQSSSASIVLNALMGQSPGLIRVEPIGNNPPYPLTETIWCSSGWQLRGYGRQSRFRVADSGNFSWGCFYFGQSLTTGYWTLSDLSFDGNRAANLNNSYLLHGRPARDIILQNVEVHDFARFAIYSAINTIRNWTIKDSNFWNCDFDAVFYAYASEGCSIENTIFGYNAQKWGEGVQNYESGDVRTWAASLEIRDCVSRYCGKDSPEGRYNVAPFHLRSARAVLIEDCLVENAGSQGVLLFDCHGAVVRRSEISGVQRYAGLYYEGCQDALVEKVRVKGAPNDCGIVLGTWPPNYKSHGAAAVDCRVSDCGGPGIITDCSRATILDCQVDNCGWQAPNQYEKAGYIVAGTGQKGSKVIRSKATRCYYGWSDTRGSGTGTSENAVVLDCDFSGCDNGLYVGQSNPDYAHTIARNKLPGG